MELYDLSLLICRQIKLQLTSEEERRAIEVMARIAAQHEDRMGMQGMVF